MDSSLSLPPATRRRRRHPWLIASLLGGALLLALIAKFSTDAGVVWDEPLQAEYGDRILRWFSSGFTDQSAMTFEDLYVYGGLFDTVAQGIAHRSTAELYALRHVLSALLAFGGIVAVGATAAKVGGPRAGFFAGAMLSLTPQWIGHGLFNPKDIPFGAAAALVSYAAIRIAMGPAPPRWRDTLLAGVAVGLALAFRPGGIFVLAYPFVAALATALVHQLGPGADRQPTAWLRAGARTALRLLPIVPIAWILMIATWPWAQLAPFTHPVEAIRIASHYRWNGVMLFDGAMVHSTNLPPGYLRTWFVLTTPETYGIALLLGVVALLRWRRPVARSVIAGHAVVLATIAIPTVGVILTRPVLYDGLRHVLFLFPMFAVVAGLAISGSLSSTIARRWRVAGIGVLAAAACLVLFDIVTLHPYEYVYFNRVSGGLPAASGRYETDYWGASYKEGLEWTLTNFVGPHPDHVISIMSCDFASNPRLEHYRGVWPGVKDRIAIVDKYAAADVYLSVTRYDCHERPGVVMHTVSRQGVPLLYVIRTERRE